MELMRRTAQPRRIHLAVGLWAVLCAWPAFAVDPIEAVGLFKDRAMLRVQGVEHYLRVGERSPEGALLISADARMAVVEFKGQRYRVGLSDRVGGQFSTAARASIAIVPDDLGQYRVSGTINGQFVNYLVDTGASVIAISSAQARGLGIDFIGTTETGSVVTAQGQAKAYFVVLDAVNVGGIEARNVRAAIIEGAYPVEVLLGMSFLRSVAMQERNGVLMLEQKH